MTVALTSLVDFKRFLAQPGATIEVVRNTFVDRQSGAAREAYRARGMYGPRAVRALSRRAAVFALPGHPGTVWLYWDKGTRKWSFEADTVRVPLAAGLGPPDEIVYRCRLAPGAESTPDAPGARAVASGAAATPLP